MTTKQQAVKARLLAETKARMEREEAEPGFAEGYAAWKREYDATTAMYKARQGDSSESHLALA